jgi:DNA-binding phage protein
MSARGNLKLVHNQPTPSRTLAVYKSYNFIDKDPVIDYVRTLVQNNGGVYAVAEASGVAYTTINNWIQGRTKRPQFATVAAVLLACGETNINLKALM